jgi:hypothetical protein
MNRLTVIVAVVTLVLGLLAGYLWWGLPGDRLRSEAGDARARADRLEEQLGQLRGQLKTEKSRLEAAEADLRREKAMTSRLQLLVSQGKK